MVRPMPFNTTLRDFVEICTRLQRGVKLLLPEICIALATGLDLLHLFTLEAEIRVQDEWYENHDVSGGSGIFQNRGRKMPSKKIVKAKLGRLCAEGVPSPLLEGY